jgi:hypothetical protein
VVLNQNLNRNMKETGISFSCAIASNAFMSTCFRRYSNISVNSMGGMYSASQIAIQGLAAFIPDGSLKFNNKLIGKQTVV